jgi:hypothetical protein
VKEYASMYGPAVAEKEEAVRVSDNMLDAYGSVVLLTSKPQVSL